LVDPDVFKPNLKGMMVGNGVTNWKYDTIPAFIEMANAHSFMDPVDYQMMKSLGCDYSGLEFDKPISAECNDLLKRFEEFTKNINVYDILGKCYFPPSRLEQSITEKIGGLKMISNKMDRRWSTFHDYTPWT